MRSLPAPMRPAATQGGSLQGVALGATGVQVPCLGVGRQGVSLPELAQQKPSPPAAPQRLPSSWMRTCSRYMPGLAASGKAGLFRLLAEGRVGTPAGDPG